MVITTATGLSVAIPKIGSLCSVPIRQFPIGAHALPLDWLGDRDDCSRYAGIATKPAGSPHLAEECGDE